MFVSNYIRAIVWCDDLLLPQVGGKVYIMIPLDATGLAVDVRL